MLLLDADWMMLTNTSNQGEANSVNTAPLAHEIQAADASHFQSYNFLKIIWRLALGFWMDLGIECLEKKY